MHPTTEAERLADDALDRLADHLVIDPGVRSDPYRLRQELDSLISAAVATRGQHSSRAIGLSGLRYGYDSQRTSFMAEQILYCSPNLVALTEILMDGQPEAIGVASSRLNDLARSLYSLLNLATLLMGGVPRG